MDTSETYKNRMIKRVLWCLFCCVAIFCGLLWLLCVPMLISNDFWRGVAYPICIIIGLGHFLMAGTFFWYSVYKGE
jgi:hypothetical protein